MKDLYSHKQVNTVGTVRRSQGKLRPIVRTANSALEMLNCCYVTGVECVLLIAHRMMC
jgi:hypothetical protein